MIGIFFDYVYYRVSKAYMRTKDSSPEFAAVCVVAGTQCFMVLECFMLLAIIMQNKSVLKLPVVIIVILFFLIINYIRYIYNENKNYKILKEKWNNETNSFRKGVLVITYIITTTALFIGLAIYLGSKKW